MQEKRRSPRIASLTRCRIDKLFSHEEPVSSRIVNYSENGLMLELDCNLAPGDAIAVQFDADAVEAAVYGSLTCIGMVRWCARVESSLGALYGVGVELANKFSNRSALSPA